MEEEIVEDLILGTEKAERMAKAERARLRRKTTRKVVYNRTENMYAKARKLRKK
jgi:hypothetical protein|tara:strand:- start:1719 stop:1880 length:162 start_codon:yes stop_codon:yes gene_type:complete